jgi:hypothetical protein
MKLPRFSLGRLLVSVTLIAIGFAMIRAFLKGQILFGNPYVHASLSLAFTMEGVCLHAAQKPLEFVLPAVIGALIGLLMI